MFDNFVDEMGEMKNFNGELDRKSTTIKKLNFANLGFHFAKKKKKIRIN